MITERANKAWWWHPAVRTTIVMLVQLVIVALSYFAAFILRLDLDIDRIRLDVVLDTLPLLIAVRLVGLIAFRLQRGMWRYVSVLDIWQIIKATTLSSLLFVAILIPIVDPPWFPRGIFVLDWAGNIFLLSGIRLLVRVFRERFRPRRGANTPSQRLLIVGAGDTGADLCAQTLNNPEFGFKPAAFVDEDTGKKGTSILGVRVVGQYNDIPHVVSEYAVDTVVIADPSLTPPETRALVAVCQQIGRPVKILPATPDILNGTINITRIRDVDPADLLGRPPARLNREVIGKFIRGKRIMVTGAGGSVGSQLARQISVMAPSQLLLVDRAENSLFFLDIELRDAYPGMPVVARVADVTDRKEIYSIMSEYRPHVVFHAAAHKHVPLMEDAPEEAIKNNVGGTYIMADCALETGVEAFILVSTDKAVKPTSVMGATKRLAELMVQEMDRRGKTRFVAVRFGNVLGSNASVVPIFKRQVAEGGPVTVTHPDAERYFMSLPEAAGLILQAAAIGAGGEIFVLDMGEPVRIVALAEMLISLSGLKPYDDIDIVFTGLRPGEKLSEQLHFDGEHFQPAGYEKLFVLKNHSSGVDVISRVETFLSKLPDLGSRDAKLYLKRLVPEYRPAGVSQKAARNLDAIPGD